MSIMSDFFLHFRPGNDTYRSGHERTRHFDIAISEINDLYSTLDETCNGCSVVLDYSLLATSNAPLSSLAAHMYYLILCIE